MDNLSIFCEVLYKARFYGTYFY